MPAELIIHNARIFTGGEPIDGAIAIEAGRILSVGEWADVRRTASQHTESIDAGGGLLTPGFIDAHVHPISGGLKILNCSLQDAATLSEATDMIAAYASSHSDREWIWGGGGPWHGSSTAFPARPPSIESSRIDPCFFTTGTVMPPG